MKEVNNTVDKEKLRYGIEMMCAALGRARALSITFAEGTHEKAWAKIDKELWDLIDMMDAHNWDVHQLFETAVNPNLDWNKHPLTRNGGSEKVKDWRKKVDQAYTTLTPRKCYSEHLQKYLLA